MDETHTAFCNLCQPAGEMPAQEILDHLRVMHPGHLADLGIDPGNIIETWPDGAPVITDETAETVADILEEDRDG